MTKTLSAKQQAAIDTLRSNPDATLADIIQAADVKGYDDNQAMFLLRLIRTGAVRLVVAE